MEITEVKVRVVPRDTSKLKAFCSITFDNCFVVKDIRIVQGLKGLIVSMPTKKLSFKCFKCNAKNPLRAKFCCECGRRVHAENLKRDPESGKPVFHVDIAHPITREMRQSIEEKIIKAYQEEFEKYRQSVAVVSPEVGAGQPVVSDPVTPPIGEVVPTVGEVAPSGVDDDEDPGL